MDRGLLCVHTWDPWWSFSFFFSLFFFFHIHLTCCCYCCCFSGIRFNLRDELVILKVVNCWPRKAAVIYRQVTAGAKGRVPNCTLYAKYQYVRICTNGIKCMAYVCWVRASEVQEGAADVSDDVVFSGTLPNGASQRQAPLCGLEMQWTVHSLHGPQGTEPTVTSSYPSRLVHYMNSHIYALSSSQTESKKEL